MTSNEPTWTLSATCRCLTEDLGLSHEMCDRPISEFIAAHQVIADFVKKRDYHLAPPPWRPSASSWMGYSSARGILSRSPA